MSSSTAGGRWSAAQRFAAVTTFLIAVIGAVTGTLSFIRQERITLSVTTGSYERSARPNGVSLGVVNSAARGVSIVGGAISFEGRELGGELRVLPDARMLTDGTATDDDLVRAAKDLPFAIGAGESLAGGITWKVTDTALGLEFKDLLDDAAFAQTMRASNRRIGLSPNTQQQVREGDAAAGRLRKGLELRLRFEPGGTETVRVPIDVAQGETSEPVWTVELVLQDSNVTGFTATQAGPAPLLTTLRLWRVDRPARAWSMTRPVISLRQGKTKTRYPVPRLKRGTYAWALTSGRDVHVADTFVTPCKQLTSTTSGARLRRTSETVDAFSCTPGQLATARDGGLFP